MNIITIGINFPWRYPLLKNVLGSKFIKMKKADSVLTIPDNKEETKEIFNRNINIIDLSTFEGILILYFCADWCNACNEDIIKNDINTSDSKTTNVLNHLYQKKQEIAKKCNCNDIEIIQISADDNEMQFIKFYSRNAWLAIPFEESIRIKNCISHT